jgi:DNA-directed RNA polymerase specialized sigma24 family protein
MAAAAFSFGNPRESLRQAMVEEILSWPELPRQIFTHAHYKGLRVDEIASRLGENALEVRQILAFYERKLRAAIRTFRPAYATR